MPKHPRATVALGHQLRALAPNSVRETTASVTQRRPIGPYRPAPTFPRVHRTMCCRAFQVARMSPGPREVKRERKEVKSKKEQKEEAIIAGN